MSLIGVFTPREMVTPRMLLSVTTVRAEQNKPAAA